MKKNIVLICYKYPPEYSGYGKQLSSVLHSMNKIEHDFGFTILTAYKSSKAEENMNVSVVPLGSKIFNKQSFFFYIFCIKLMFWLILNRREYSIIHCIKAGPEAIVANFISKIFRKKLIVKVAQDELSVREIEVASRPKRIGRKARHLLLRTVDNYIAISEEIEENIKKTISRNKGVFNIPNGVNEKQYHPVENSVKLDIRLNLELPSDDVIILFAGAINKRKGVVDLLEAINKLNNKKKCTVVMCGPILEDIDFERKIKKINKTKKNIDIIYKGKVNNTDEYMKAADIFILPSYSEGLPNVLLEAAASGLALIATDIGGNRDIIKDGRNGFLVPINTPTVLANKIDALIDDDELRLEMGIEAVRYIKSSFTLEHVSNMYFQLYESINN